MTAEMLRRAASLMRERAEGATSGGPRWETGPDEMHGPSHAIVYPADSDSAVAFAASDNAEHIASWHPAVALAVADWLDACALVCEVKADAVKHHALTIARAYLGESS